MTDNVTFHTIYHGRKLYPYRFYFQDLVYFLFSCVYDKWHTVQKTVREGERGGDRLLMTRKKRRGEDTWTRWGGENYELPSALRFLLTLINTWGIGRSRELGYAVINLVKPQPAQVINDTPLCAIKQRQRRVFSPRTKTAQHCQGNMAF